ncbi:hypothetical protein CspeluHIS016_0204740 [Cutaneotrichosporon spelunceum]|uniref:AA1-like domain-containing protein n=1 Tax=Cutaneotrichosporon spelunceum TaxID=1672016 RepID=A0AAD3YAV2_9TREE|nr:hypothetical protein CspeluHIS016_0204740 [Cutaneotrichosporon spelunceum]
MLAKTFLALFAAAAAIAAPAEHEERDLENRDLEGRALCPGTLIDGPRTILNGAGTLRVYYTTASGGTNCAYVTNDTGAKANMKLTLWDTSDPKYRSSIDEGSFFSYAGPVKLSTMANRCMQVRVTINGQSWQSMKAWHCGSGQVAGAGGGGNPPPPPRLGAPNNAW